MKGNSTATGRPQAAEARKTARPLKDKTYVYTIRDWKEYLGESLLIIFSVLLALILTEYFNNLHEKENTRSMVKDIIAELRQDKQSLLEMQRYDADVLQRINRALNDVAMQQQLVSNDEFHLALIAPNGVLYRYMNDEAWNIAKNNNIMAKLDMTDLKGLSVLYGDLARIGKVEDQVASVIFDRNARDPAQVHKTLVIIRDMFHGWAVDRMPGLFAQIDAVIRRLERY